MHFVLTANIRIDSEKQWTFSKVASVEIVRDSESLTDTATLTLPQKVKWKDSSGIPVRLGDPVTVELGYDGRLETAFRGYVTRIGGKDAVKITCEDEMFRLKQRAARRLSYRSVTLGQLLEEQQLGVAVKVSGEQRLGAYRVTADTVAALLNDLKEQGIRAFFRYAADGTPTLHCGVLFEQQGERVQVFDNRRNMVDHAGLEIRRADEVKLRVRAVAPGPKNETVTVEVGDEQGEVRTLRAYNKTEPELRAWAEQELKRLKQDGLAGSFKTFGARLVDKLDTIGIVLDKEKKGLYQVKKNTITYSKGGFRQQIELGNRLDTQR